MSKRLVGRDAFTGISTYHDYDHATKTTFIQEVQDTKAILRQAKDLANNTAYKQQGIKNDWYHFARIPNGVLLELKEKYGLDWQQKDDLPKIEKVLSRDYKKLLTVDRI